MAFLLNISLFAVAFIFIYKLFYESVRKVYLSMKIPGPVAYPIIGNGLYFLNKTSAENLEIVRGFLNDYGDYVRIWIGLDLNIFLKNPKDVEMVLSNQKFIEKASLYRFLKPWLKEGLLLSKGKKWYQRRKILTPAFHFKILEQFIDTFDRQSNTLIESLAKVDHQETVELYPIVTLCALDVICESAMGTSINAQLQSDSEYVRAVKKISTIIHLRMFRFWLQQEFYFRFTSTAREQEQALRVLHSFTDSVIRDRRNEILNNNSQKQNELKPADDDIGSKRKMAFLDILLQSTIDGQPLSDLDIREEVDTFMFEGHDTTTSGIVFGLYSIALRPHIQEKCYREIIDILGTDKSEPVTLSKLNDLNYLELVIKEALRMFPSVPLIARRVTEEVTINGKTLPADSNIVVPVYFMGYDAKTFDKPDEFLPERFSIDSTEAETINPFAYVPFSAGPRNCIGQKFAMLELKSVISKVLRHYEIGLADDSRMYPCLQAELIITAENKINFTLKKRS